MPKRRINEPIDADRTRVRTDLATRAEALPDRDAMWAWERFLTGEPEAAIPLGHVVVSSWQRSLALGVNPTGRAAPIAAQGDSILTLRHRNRDLIAASRDLFQRIADVFAGSNCMMLLTDPDGIVLEAVGDHRTLGQGERIHLVAGGHWREDVIGTNGIGTALATGQPAQVHATEHFCEGIKSWTCAAAPVREPGSGRILGVVDISGPPSTYQRGNLSLAVATARQIETALAERSGRERVRLLERCLQRMPMIGNAELLAIDRSGRIVYSNGKGALPGLGETLAGFDPDQPVERWFDRMPEPLRADGAFDPVVLDDRTVGAMIVVPARNRPAKLAAPPAGSEADASRSAFHHIIGASAAMLQATRRAEQLARHRVPVLIHGETGVGKELLARAMHGSLDFSAPFVVFNCGAASKDLIGAELFGHVKGAFTGATADGRPGRFELADGGTLCLDEIGELPLELQPLLLRALEEGVIYRLGDTTPRKVAVRLVAMTNRDLRDEVAAGRFRRDLFYRINVTSITVPPLRARSGDVDLLIEHFNASVAARHGVPPRRFGPALLAVLRAYHWPGNVRELRNLVESLLLAGESADVGIDEIPLDMRGGAADDAPASGRLVDIEAEAMHRAIEAAGGNISGAARLLGVSRSTLHRRLGRAGSH
ncbi:sigma-54-dependent Fis family transcriptional regulator [Acidiphilium sp. PA]|uniref:sigma-54-dependent Fis family transcriptional regulator n=1 Tax=Acidiphilium sp. PA TaxID=2871705 RepID=UPI0022434B0C|nr:sigma-54-dependent Fis family transcriptional regulator [Acidiphilium sp. PA]MCW8305546.1 sigma-54-dependent Fis family transcriptional regulator [Acidiphilium sp. PA]